MNKNLLPLGSIVKLKDAEDKLVMIIGRGMVEKQEDGTKNIIDYLGCIYPNGVIQSNYNLYFNDSDIVETVHVGFKNELEDTYLEQYQKMLDICRGNDEEIENVTEEIEVL